MKGKKKVGYSSSANFSSPKTQICFSAGDVTVLIEEYFGKGRRSRDPGGG